MVVALLDTNILIDYLNGIDAARVELQRYSDRRISVITWMEVMVGANPATHDATSQFLAGFTLVNIDRQIAQRAVAVRRDRGMKLPDAIIWATALEYHALLVTRNTKDFPTDDPSVRIPYRL